MWSIVPVDWMVVLQIFPRIVGGGGFMGAIAREGILDIGRWMQKPVCWGSRVKGYFVGH